MDHLIELSPEGLQTARLQQMTESLYNMRIADKSDVRLICQDKEFFAHKLILASASPYFASMYSGKIKKQSIEKLTFDKIEADIMEAVLDYIYLGKVESIKTEAQLKKLLTVSHAMELDKLFHYCCNSLGNLLSLSNFFEIFSISEQYESDILSKKVVNFWIVNVNRLLDSEQFFSLSVLELKALVNYLKRQRLSLDSVVGAVVHWLLHDLKRREMFAGDVLNCFDGELLSKEYIKSLLQNHDLVEASHIISNELISLSKAVNKCDDVALSKKFSLKADSHLWTTTLSCFSEYCTIDVFDVTANKDEAVVKVAHSLKRRCVQQFDLDKMTWLPPRYPDTSNLQEWNTYHMCQLKNYVYLFSSYECNYAVYNLQNHSVYVERFTTKLDIPIDCTICYFKNYFHVIGGTDAQGSVICLYPDTNTQIKGSALPLAPNQYPTTLTSIDYIYVITDNLESKEVLAIQFNSNPAEGCQWEVLCIRRQGLEPSQFFTLNNTLNALHFGHYECTQLQYSHISKHFTGKRQFNWPDAELTSLELSKFQNPQCPFVFFSKKDDHFNIPCYHWEPETGKWNKLRPPQGRCCIPNYKRVAMCYSLEK